MIIDRTCKIIRGVACKKCIMCNSYMTKINYQKYDGVCWTCHMNELVTK